MQARSSVSNVSVCDFLLLQRRYTLLKQQELKEDRLLLLVAWRESEQAAVDAGLPGDTRSVDDRMPKKVKMRRMATGEGGAELGWEEYYDYIFPDDEKKIGMDVSPLLILIPSSLMKLQTLHFSKLVPPHFYCLVLV